jgi:hypothetical protein
MRSRSNHLKQAKKPCANVAKSTIFHTHNHNDIHLPSNPITARHLYEGGNCPPSLVSPTGKFGLVPPAEFKLLR